MPNPPIPPTVRSFAASTRPAAAPTAIITTPKTDDTKKVFFTIANKGGVGKTVLARALLDYCLAKNIDIRAFDTDKMVCQLQQYYGDRVHKFDIKDPAETALLIDALDDFGNANLLFDLPGGVLPNLRQIFNSADCRPIGETIAAQGYELNLLIPITPFSASIQSVRDLIDQFGPTAKYHVFKQVSFIAGSVKTFDLWETVNLFDPAELEQDFAVRHGANVYEMPELAANVLARLDVCNVPFTTAKDMPSNRFWTTSHRGNVGHWLDKVYAMLAQIV